MSRIWHDIRGALSWGFWIGLSVAMVFLTIDAIRHGAASADRIDVVALLPGTIMAFAGGFVAGSLAHAYLRGLEKKAEAREP